MGCQPSSLMPCIVAGGGGPGLRGGGSSSSNTSELPKEIQEFLEYQRYEHRLPQEEIAAFEEFQRTRVTNRMPVAVVWDDIVSQLESGDLVLFRGRNLPSKLILWFTGEFSHVGFVVIGTVAHPVTGARVKTIRILEAIGHADECLDAITGQPKAGVRLVDLKSRLLSSDSAYFGIVKIGRKPTAASQPDAALISRSAELEKRLDRFCRRESFKPYEPNKINLFRVAFECTGRAFRQRQRHNTPGDSYFCSKLVCEALEHVGIIDTIINPDAVAPTDFWDYDLGLENGYFVRGLFYMPRLDLAMELRAPLGGDATTGHHIQMMSDDGTMSLSPPAVDESGRIAVSQPQRMLLRIEQHPPKRQQHNNESDTDTLSSVSSTREDHRQQQKKDKKQHRQRASQESLGSVKPPPSPSSSSHRSHHHQHTASPAKQLHNAKSSAKPGTKGQ